MSVDPSLRWDDGVVLNPATIRVRHDKRIGDDALIVDLHRLGYAVHGPRFSDSFAQFVGETLEEAGLDHADKSRVWFVETPAMVLGCAALVDRGDKAQLRWVVVRPEARGLGLGRKLVALALEYARSEGYGAVYLETTDGLDESMGLYEALGFQTVTDEPSELWHGTGRLIIMNLRLDSRQG